MQNNEKRSHRVLLRRVLLVVAGVVVGLKLYSWNASSLAGNQMPMPFGIGVSVVMSGSMEPELSVNDLVIVREAEEYEIGDVVVYQSGNVLVIHRIVDMDGTTVTTRGDANEVKDQPFDSSLIKGKLVCALPLVGGVVRVLKSTPGTIVLIGLIIFLMERSWQKEKSEDQEKLDSIKEEIRAIQKELEERKETEI